MKQMVYDAYSNRMEDMHYLEDKFEAYELLKPYYKREIIKIMSKEDFLNSQILYLDIGSLF